MRILLCKKCHELPRYAHEDLCIDCLPPEVLDQYTAQHRVEEELDAKNHIDWMSRGGDPAESEDL